MKRRKGKRKPAAGKQQNEHSGAFETIDINRMHEGGGDVDDSGDVEKDVTSQMPDQLTKYTGKMREVMDRSKLNMDIYLLNINGFPSPEELTSWTQSAYRYGAMYVYGDKYDRKCKLFVPSRG